MLSFTDELRKEAGVSSSLGKLLLKGSKKLREKAGRKTTGRMMGAAGKWMSESPYAANLLLGFTALYPTYYQQLAPPELRPPGRASARVHNLRLFWFLHTHRVW